MKVLWTREMSSAPDIGTAARKSLSRQSMLAKIVLNWITGFVACLSVLSLLSCVHNTTHRMVTYVHGLFTENTCNRVSWIWGCKLQSDTIQTAGKVHMAEQTVMGASLIEAMCLGVCVTPGAISNITSNGARMGMPAILSIAGHTMRSVSWNQIKDIEAKV